MFHNAPANGQTQPGPFTLCGKIGLKEFVVIFRGYSGPVVSNAYQVGFPSSFNCTLITPIACP